LNSYGITKADRHLIDTEDNIHCEVCRQHIGDHGLLDGHLLHPDHIVEILKDK
jgi:hypothetical protein